MNELERVTLAVEQELDRDFEAWLARWCSPAGMFADAPEPPSRYTTSPERIAKAALKAHAEHLAEQGLVVVPRGLPNTDATGQYIIPPSAAHQQEE